MSRTAERGDGAVAFIVCALEAGNNVFTWCLQDGRTDKRVRRSQQTAVLPAFSLHIQAHCLITYTRACKRVREAEMHADKATRLVNCMRTQTQIQQIHTDRQNYRHSHRHRHRHQRTEIDADTDTGTDTDTDTGTDTNKDADAGTNTKT